MTTVIIVLAVVVVIVGLIALYRNSQEQRREAAAGLRKEAIDREGEARAAQIEADRQREAAEKRKKRADRVDPDVETSGNGGVFSRLRSRKDVDDVDETDEDVDRDADD